MATSKRHPTQAQAQALTLTKLPTFDESSSSAQIPTTSANSHNHNVNWNNDSSAANLYSSNLINYCHHQAATRSISDNNYNRNPIDHSSAPIIDISDEDPSTRPPHYYDIPGIVPAYQGRSSAPPPAYDEVMNPNAPPPTYQSLFGQVREARKTSNGLVDLCRQLFLILIGTIGCTMIIGFLLLIPITMILVGIFYANECKAENIPSFLVIGGFVWIVKNILNCYNQFKRDSSIVNRPPPRRVPISPQANHQVARPPSFSLVTSNIRVSDVSDMENPPTTIQPDTQSTSPPLTTVMASSTITREHNYQIRHPPMIGLTSFKCESILNYFLLVWFLAGCIVVYRIYEPDYDNPASSSYCHRTVYLYAFWLLTSAFIMMAIILSCLCCFMASSLLTCNRSR